MTGKHKLTVFLLSVFLLAAAAFFQAAPRTPGETQLRMEEAKLAMDEWRVRDGLELLRGILQEEPGNLEALYLQGELLASIGHPRAWEISESLNRAGRVRDADVLTLKIDLFLGVRDLPQRLAQARKKHGEDAELMLVEWLLRLDRGEIAWAEENFPDPDRLLMGWQPYRALSVALQRKQPAKAAVWAEKGLQRGAALFQRVLDGIRLELERPALSHDIREQELPYRQCGPYFGFLMEDAAGKKLSMSLDTGTSGGMFTVHDRQVGDALAGEILAVRPGAIQYNYMNEAADAFYKTVNFRSPALNGFPVVYFQGNLPASDGVCSPFAFPDLAVTVDPVQEKVFLRNREALESYLDGAGDYLCLPYLERNGWIYVPGKLADKEVLFMVETGSRDVNVNALALKRFDLPSRSATITWRGEERPVTRPDFSFDLAGISYRPADGLVSDFALGSHGAGLGSAGDIGPGFFRHYRFTIDPFAGRIILEKPDGETTCE